MPLLRVTHQRGALSDTQKDALAERLTAAMLMGEVGADTPPGRAVAYVLFDEVDAARAWYVGGKPDRAPPPGGRLLFDVVYPEGAASQADKSTLHAAINSAVADVLGVDATFPNRAGDWVIVHEPADGAWGAGDRRSAFGRSTSSQAASRNEPTTSNRSSPLKSACETRTASQPSPREAERCAGVLPCRTANPCPGRGDISHARRSVSRRRSWQKAWSAGDVRPGPRRRPLSRLSERSSRNERSPALIRKCR